MTVIERKVMTPDKARTLAIDLYFNQFNEWGESLIDVAMVIADSAIIRDAADDHTTITALLQFATKVQPPATLDGLRLSGCAEVVIDALIALDRRPGEAFADHIRRVTANRIAATVLRASTRTYISYATSAGEAKVSTGQLERLERTDEMLIDRSELPTVELFNAIDNGDIDYDNVVHQLIRQRGLAEAELAAVRGEVKKLLAGPYAPSMFLIRDALHPAAHVIERYRIKTEVAQGT